MAPILQGGKRDLSSQGSAFVVSNFTEDFTFDDNTAALADTNHALGTLIRELIRAGVINGSVS